MYMRECQLVPNGQVTGTYAQKKRAGIAHVGVSGSCNAPGRSATYQTVSEVASKYVDPLGSGKSIGYCKIGYRLDGEYDESVSLTVNTAPSGPPPRA